MSKKKNIKDIFMMYEFGILDSLTQNSNIKTER